MHEEWHNHDGVIETRFPPSGRRIATMNPQGTKSDADLIVKAPEMAEALESMLAVFDRGLTEGTMGRIVCDSAIEALSEVEGK